MTKEEAIKAMNRGLKVRHRYFSPDEYITMQGTMIVTEEGYKIRQEQFWADRNLPEWEKDWELDYPERKLGQQVPFDGLTLEVQAGCGCIDCSLYGMCNHNKTNPTFKEQLGFCSAFIRTDGTSVIFRLVKVQSN